MELVEKSVDPQFWHACAGGMVQMPLVNSKVFYFPQGHAEHSHSVDFGALPTSPAMILCRVVGVKFLADPETDEVYARMRLVPVRNNKHCDLGEDESWNNISESVDKPASFAKTLTQSDANNGGGFSVPRSCADTIFPRLDYNAEPPVQNVTVKDALGETWKFRHIYRGTPRRHLLTTGWSAFVNQKKLVAGDSIVFFRANNGDICVGIRRAKKSGSGCLESPYRLNTSSENYGRIAASLRDDDSKVMRNVSITCLNDPGGAQGRVRLDSVIEAASLAASGQPFEVVYYPRSNTPEFCVKASLIRTAMSVQWHSGMRFRMPLEMEDSSRISWFMGTVTSVQATDPHHWPDSQWRVLQVEWDEQGLLQNVKCVSPWLVEVVSNFPTFDPPMKRLCIRQQSDISFECQLPLPSFSSSPFGTSNLFSCLPDNFAAVIQGARHAQYGGPLIDLHPNNQLQLGLLSTSSQQLNAYSEFSEGMSRVHRDGNNNISCLLTIGNSSQKIENSENDQKPRFILFGQPILTEQQMFHGSTRDPISQPPKEKIPDLNGEILQQIAEFGLGNSRCKVFLNSVDTLWNLDLSILASYEELYIRLSSIFGIERSNLLRKVQYCDAKGALKHTEDEPFSVFMRTAKRMNIVTNSGSNTAGSCDQNQIQSNSRF
ncbi:hypothetical protein Leryth_011775 [Lithospermum erythrorhizon]|nr:hypothetical protein Leryth_011775 [Lithospermum erythrorhizon]